MTPFSERRAVLLVLDSVGIGAAPDAARYGDAGANTLAHLAAAVGGLHCPTLQRLGLGNIPALFRGGKTLAGLPAHPQPAAAYGAMNPRSEGKDTTTGHWELAGLLMRPGFSTFPPGPPSFPPDLTRAFEQRTRRRILGNKAASGTAIIEELGREHLRTGAWIAYTSADSVFQLAAHTSVVPLPELYRACETARALCDPLRIGRVIARPFEGRPGRFRRTRDRRDFSLTPGEATLLDRLTAAGIPVHGIGKIEDIFAGRGLSSSKHAGGTREAQEALVRWTSQPRRGLCFVNFIDFDMLYGHRRDAHGYARALEQTDSFLGSYLKRLKKDDLLIVTADHGNDPTYRGTDHTRERVPLLVYRSGNSGRKLGVRRGFFDVAQSLASWFGRPAMPHGRSFIAGNGAWAGDP